MRALVAISLLMVCAWLFRGPLLQGLARMWIVTEDPVAAADAVVVLGGGIETRPFAAADYYRRGLARRILVSDVRLSRSERLGIFPSQFDLNRRVLMQLVIPAEAIEALGAANRNTHDEALALRQWVGRNPVRSIIVPTEIFSSRRVKWIMEAALAESETLVQVPSFDTEDYNRDDWWQRDLGLIAFQNEAVKYAYYRLKY